MISDLGVPSSFRTLRLKSSPIVSEILVKCNGGLTTHAYAMSERLYDDIISIDVENSRQVDVVYTDYVQKREGGFYNKAGFVGTFLPNRSEFILTNESLGSTISAIYGVNSLHFISLIVCLYIF